MAHFTVRADIYPTEDEDAVLTAVEQVLPLESVRVEGEWQEVRVLMGRGSMEGLRVLHALLRKQRILDTARSVLLAGCGAGGLTFSLNKQAATVGRVSFAIENELYGPIDVLVVCAHPEKMVDWLAPPTQEGVPLFEIEEPEG